MDKKALLKWLALAAAGAGLAAAASSTPKKDEEDSDAASHLSYGRANPSFTLETRTGMFGPYRFQVDVPRGFTEQRFEYEIADIGHVAFVWQNESEHYAHTPDSPFERERIQERGVSESIQVDFLDIDLSRQSVDSIVALQEEILLSGPEGVEIRESQPSSFGPYRDAYRLTIAYPDPSGGGMVIQYGYFAIVDGRLGVNVFAVGPESNFSAFRSLYDEALASFRVVAIQ